MKLEWNWGKGMVTVYIVFVIATLSFVGFALTQKVELVSKDYYAQEVAYQKRIEQIKRTNALVESIDVTIANNNINIVFPTEAIPQKGTIHFYHPSTSSLDTVITIKENNSDKNMVIDIAALPKGRWKIVSEWFSNNTDYYDESVITL